jgi:hypothetical protein
VTEGFRDLKGSRSIRFGCGAIAGLLFGFYLSVEYVAGGWKSALGWLFLGGLAFGLLSAFAGDRFWAGIHRWLWW